MLLLLDAPLNTELVEIICMLKSKGINYRTADQLDEFYEFFERGTLDEIETPQLASNIPILTTEDLQMLSIQGIIESQKTVIDEVKRNSECEQLTTDVSEEPKKKKKNIKANTAVLRSPCSMCGTQIASSTKRYLMLHARLHMKINGYKCSQCTTTFLHSSTARVHIVKNHGSTGAVLDIFNEENFKELEDVLHTCFPEAMQRIAGKGKQASNSASQKVNSPNDSDMDVICIDESADENSDNDVIALSPPRLGGEEEGDRCL